MLRERSGIAMITHGDSRDGFVVRRQIESRFDLVRIHDRPYAHDQAERGGLDHQVLHG
jgi:hypothetical protein